MVWKQVKPVSGQRSFNTTQPESKNASIVKQIHTTSKKKKEKNNQWKMSASSESLEKEF